LKNSKSSLNQTLRDYERGGGISFSLGVCVGNTKLIGEIFPQKIFNIGEKRPLST
jgi:hypothetical protein